jgi:alkanesulfonate monooxygenase SsuD/methylene tetrahydromethanopterin reductase-like flavin-dependent oxidoreductase (luciferase family)
MKFGLLYIPDYYPDRYKSASHYYGEMMEQIQHEEELGFDGVFFAEHYVGGYAFPSPPVFATADQAHPSGHGRDAVAAE